MAAALVVAAVIVLFATGIIPVGGDGPPPPPPDSSNVPPDGWTADDDTLIGYLKKPGYDRSNCTPQHPPKDNSLSTLECDALSGGPDSATFFLYPDQSALDEGFKNATSSASLQTCPDGTVVARNVALHQRPDGDGRPDRVRNGRRRRGGHLD